MKKQDELLSTKENELEVIIPPNDILTNYLGEIFAGKGGPPGGGPIGPTGEPCCQCIINCKNFDF